MSNLHVYKYESRRQRLTPCWCSKRRAIAVPLRKHWLQCLTILASNLLGRKMSWVLGIHWWEVHSGPSSPSTLEIVWVGQSCHGYHPSPSRQGCHGNLVAAIRYYPPPTYQRQAHLLVMSLNVVNVYLSKVKLTLVVT